MPLDTVEIILPPSSPARSKAAVDETSGPLMSKKIHGLLTERIRNKTEGFLQLWAIFFFIGAFVSHNQIF